jgi:DNA-binding NtrC family response regulator
LTTILVVDDDVGIRTMLCSVLYDEGYDVKAVDKGKNAVKACEKSPFDVALVDLELPDMKGTELLSRLKKLQPRMIKVIITGHPTLESAVKSVNERADGYVLKPFDVAELLSLIRKLLAERTDEYLSVLAQSEQAKESTPIVHYRDPHRW